MMNILIINGSPHQEGATALMISEFMRGAEESGHSINYFDAAKEPVHGCIGCDTCRRMENGCIYKDGMEKLNPMLFWADLIVLSTPLYYFGMSSQIKTVIDRFYANNTALRSENKKIALLSACGDNEDWTVEALKAHYESLCRYLRWESVGEIYAKGIYTRKDMESSAFPKKAYEFGHRI